MTRIYGFNDKYVIATVANAKALVDKPAYTSFEESDFSRSGWTLTGTRSININSPSQTGNNNFTLQASGTNSLSASGLNTATGYILSFWATNANVSISAGATLTKSAPTYNGYTYYEYSIVGGTSSVTVKGGASAVNIDELRLYPAGARMRTTTYDPLVGKTSDCDENNRITYFTYDNLGRQQFIEDEQHNIIKMFEYNNVSQSKQTGCPASFSSRPINELVVRSNCGSGFQGSSVSYTVAAGQFTSTISQLDADVQAEIYFLTNSQTYANTNGSCAMIYFNFAQSQTDTTQSCTNDSTGGLYTYTVPAGRYSSIISQADANQQASDDIAANAQMYANLPANQKCLVNTSPDWEWFPGDDQNPTPDPSYCANIGGALPPHLMILLTDVNPNSPTFNQTMWEDDGPSNACPAGNYYNIVEGGTFTRNNCGTGYTGGSVTYSVPPGKYSSTASLTAANQLALNDVAANGQNYANTNGTCTGNCNLTAGTGFSMVTQGISSTLTTTTMSMVVTATGSVNWNQTNQIALISGSTCAPTVNRSFQATSATPAGTVWNMTVNTGGQISIQLFSGTAPTSTVQFTNISFNK